MLLKRHSLLLIALSALSNTVCHADDELETRTKVQNRVWNDIVNENFLRIESQGKAYLEKQERTPSGLWKLTLLTAGISRYMSQGFKLSSKEEGLAAWRKAYPQSSTEFFAEIQLLLLRADSITGMSGTSEIDPEAIEPYQRLIKRARNQLEARKSSLRKDPRWYSFMLQIAKLQKWEKADFNELASEALDTHPYFYQNYFYVVDYIATQRPVYEREIEALAQSAIKRTQTIDGDGLYARIYWYASQSYYGESIFNNAKPSWPLMKAGFNDIMRKYPDNWNLNNYARFACLSGDHEAADHLFQMVKENMIEDIWGPEALKNCTMPRPQEPAPANTLSAL